MTDIIQKISEQVSEIVAEQVEKTRQATIKECIKEVETNQDGSFEDDAGNLCWYQEKLLQVLKDKLTE